MKKLALTIITIISLCSANLSYGAERYVMLKIDNATPSTSLAIAANEVVQTLWASSLTVDDGSKLEVTYGGLTKRIGTSGVGVNLSIFWIPGPATLTFSSNDGNAQLVAVKVLPNPNINGVGQ